MKKVPLFDRVEEIYDILPKRYRDLIINMILSRAMDNGDFLKEIKPILKKEDFLELSKQIKALTGEVKEKVSAKKIVERKKEPEVEVKEIKTDSNLPKGVDSFSF